MRLILLGAPGSGKGTQGARLSRSHKVPCIATGDILRAEIAAKTPRGIAAQAFVDVGSLVPEDVMLAMMGVRLGQDDVAQGFILDGFPRTIPQAEGLDGILKALAIRIDAVVKLDVSKRVLIERMAGRLLCGNCAAVFHQSGSPPETAGICDRCGGALVHRVDDTVDTVRRRLNVYEGSTAPLIDYYDGQGLLVIVDGEGTAAEVEERIERALAKRGGENRPDGR